MSIEFSINFEVPAKIIYNAIVDPMYPPPQLSP